MNTELTKSTGKTLWGGVDFVFHTVQVTVVKMANASLKENGIKMKDAGCGR